MSTLSQLESQLAELNRLIFETKCNNTVQPDYAPINLSLSEVTVTNNKHNENALIISEQAHIDFLLAGKSVTIIKPRKPRKSERTWVNNKGSLWSVGSKSNTLSQCGIIKRAHG